MVQIKNDRIISDRVGWTCVAANSNEVHSRRGEIERRRMTVLSRGDSFVLLRVPLRVVDTVPRERSRGTTVQSLHAIPQRGVKDF